MEAEPKSTAVSHLAQTIYAHLDTRSHQELLHRAHSLGLPLKPTSTPEEIVLRLAQLIANLLDEISPDEAHRRMKEGGQRIEGLSTLHSAPNCRAGNLNIAALAFSPDSQTLASGSYGGVIRLWDVLGARELQHWQAHNDGINAVVYSLDGAQLFSASVDAKCCRRPARSGRSWATAAW